MAKIIELLEDLRQRLTEDYAGDTPFDQKEEDRLAVGNAIDMFYSLTAEKTEAKLDKALVHHRFDDLEELSYEIENSVYGCSVKGIEESWKNEDDEFNGLDYELLCELNVNGMAFFLTIYYSKIKNGKIYITEICLEEE